MPGSSETVCAQRCGQMSPLPKTPNCRSSGSLLRQRSCEVRIRQESNLRVHVSVCVMMNAEEGTPQRNRRRKSCETRTWKQATRHSRIQECCILSYREAR